MKMVEMMVEMMVRNQQMNTFEKLKKACLVFGLSLVLLLGGICPALIVYAKEQKNIPTSTSILEAMADYYDVKPEELLNSEICEPGDGYSNWLLLACALSDMKEDYSGYLDGMRAFVKERYETDGYIDPVKATEGQRLSMAATALGADPQALVELSSGEMVNLLADSSYNWTTTNSLDTQGLNAWIFALIAMDCHNYDVPDDAIYSRDIILENFIATQNEDGGFGLTVGSSDIDITAMALQSMAPYQDRKEIAEVIDKALNYLSKEQTPDGDFICFDVQNCESTAQVMIALTSLGIDPAQDERFQKENGNVVDGLLKFQREDGLFTHSAEDDTEDLLATEQATLATLALEKFEKDQGRLYDLSNIKFSEKQENSISNISLNNSKFIVIVILAVLLIILIVLEGIQISKSKKRKIAKSAKKKTRSRKR